MRILLTTQLLDPEPNYPRGLEYSRMIRSQGREIEVLTDYPNYPTGKLYPGFRIRLWEFEWIQGVRIIRVLVVTAGPGNLLQHILNYQSLAFSVCIHGFFLIKRPDIVHIYKQPATLFLPALVGHLLVRPYLIDLQDLWPKSLIHSLPPWIRWMNHFLDCWCRLVYRYADRVVVHSEGYATPSVFTSS